MGGGTIFQFYGGRHSCYEGGHRAHGGIPPLGKTLQFVDKFDTPGNLIGQSFQIEIHVQKTISQQMRAQTLSYLECLSYA